MQANLLTNTSNTTADSDFWAVLAVREDRMVYSSPDGEGGLDHPRVQYSVAQSFLKGEVGSQTFRDQAITSCVCCKPSQAA